MCRTQDFSRVVRVGVGVRVRVAIVECQLYHSSHILHNLVSSDSISSELIGTGQRTLFSVQLR